MMYTNWCDIVLQHMLSISAFITGSVLTVWVQKLTKRHQCFPPPPLNATDVPYYKGRCKKLVEGKRTHMCIWQHTMNVTGFGDGGVVHREDTTTEYMRCRDGKPVTPS